MAGRQFFGTFQNKLDSKNRISIPSGFRNVTRVIGAESLILRRSRRFPAIEAFPDVYFAEYESRLDAKDVFSDDHYDVAWDTYADATEVEMDRDGRITLTPDLIAAAGLSGEVAVVGLGKHFEFWDPVAAQARADERRPRPTWTPGAAKQSEP